MRKVGIDYGFVLVKVLPLDFLMQFETARGTMTFIAVQIPRNTILSF